MSRIDYSKWNKLEEYDDLSDDDTNEDSPRPFSQGGGAARVTRLDQPSTVTRTATGEIIIQDATVVASDDGRDVAKRSDDSSGRRRHSDPASQAQAAPREGMAVPELSSVQGSTPVPAHWTDKGGSCEYQGTTVHWSQDRLTVTVRVRLCSGGDDDADTFQRAKKPQQGRYLCTVSQMLPYGRRDSAVSQERCRLRVVDRWKGSGGAVVVDGELPHPVHANQDDSDEEGDDVDQVDWVIERLHDEAGGKDAKWIEICLNKASPMAGVTLWWKQPFADAPEIALEDLPTSRASSSSQAFASAWKEAHEQFREKIKRQKAGTQADG